MCVIIVKPYGQIVSDKVLKKSSEINKDGVGIYSHNPATGKTNIVKDLNYNEKLAAKYNKEHLFTIYHFRLVSAGNHKSKNVHPHRIRDDWWLFHNGTVYSLSGDKNISDTKLLANMLSQFKFFEPEPLGEIIETFTVNKFVIANRDEYYIVNEELGEWYEGCWFSNDKPINNKVEIFVYGTTKQGFSDHHLIDKGRFVDYAETLFKYPMVMNELMPIMIDNSGVGHCVQGEVWEVNESVIDSLMSSPFDPHYYHQKKIRVEINKEKSRMWKTVTTLMVVHRDSLILNSVMLKEFNAYLDFNFDDYYRYNNSNIVRGVDANIKPLEQFTTKNN